MDSVGRLRHAVLWTVALGGLAQSVAGAAGALVTAQLTGGPSLAGAPQSALVIGAALAAVPLARLAARTNRLTSCAVGCLLGAVGCLVVLGALAMPMGRTPVVAVAGVVAGSLLLGAGNTAVMLTRYAGPMVRPDLDPGRAVATVLVAISAGAVLGPNLIGVGAHLPPLLGLDAPPISGAYAIGALAYMVAASCAAAWPGTRVSTVQSPTYAVPGRIAAAASAVGQRRPEAVAGVATLALSNLVMVGVMTMSAVQLHHHGSGLTFIGFVISAHIAAMFAPAPISGRLTTRLGPGRAGVLAGCLLTAACVLAAQSPSGTALGAAMVVLGLGWNLALVSGSVLLTRGVPLHLRAGRESAGEAGAAAAAFVGGIGASALMGSAGYPLLAYAGAVLGGVLAATLLWLRVTSRDTHALPPAPAPTPGWHQTTHQPTKGGVTP